MPTIDIVLHETGSGGDFSLENNDLQTGESLFQNIFLALFGGNIESSTKSAYLENEQRDDYWGNDLIWNAAKTKQFNSDTERVLNNLPLNSRARITIQQAVENDLAYLKGVVDVSVEVNIISASRVAIVITLKEKTNQQDKILQLIFDNIKNEVIIDQLI